MKHLWFFLVITLFISSCTSSKKLGYLNGLSENSSDVTYPAEIPDYRIQPRDILFISIKAMTPDGMITDFLGESRTTGNTNYFQNESGQYLYGYDVNNDGLIILPVLGKLAVTGKTLNETRDLIQQKANSSYNNATVECKLLSFKFTVIGEVRAPGTYINYNNYLTVLEAIGRAEGLTDFGRRDNVKVVRPLNGGTKIYSLNLQDKDLLSNEVYFLLPNDVVIIEPEKKKIFNLNLPTYSFILTSVTSLLTTTLLLINYIGK